MDCNETTRILNSETNEQLLKTRDEELARVRKLRLVHQELKKMDYTKLPLPDKEQVEKAIKILKIAHYLYFNDKKDQCLLNLGEVAAVNLNYTERKAIRHELATILQHNLQRVSALNTKLRTELPEVFSDAASLQKQILALEKQRRLNFENLVQLRNRKCNLLKVAAELKMGPYLACELEVMLTKARKNQTKVNLLRNYFINEFLTRTEHNLKAIREIEGYINDALEKEEDSNN